MTVLPKLRGFFRDAAACAGWRFPDCAPAVAAAAFLALSTNAHAQTNQPPEATSPVDPVNLVATYPSFTADASDRFDDPENDPITYSVSVTEGTRFVTASVTGSDVTIAPVAAGTATVRVTATSTGGAGTLDIAVTEASQPALEFVRLPTPRTFTVGEPTRTRVMSFIGGNAGFEA